MYRPAGEANRAPYPLNEILDGLRHGVIEFNKFLAYVEDIVTYGNSTQLDTLTALKILIRVMAIARNNYEAEKELESGHPVRERREVTPPTAIYSKVMAAIKQPDAQGMWGVTTTTLYLAEPVIDMMMSIYSVLTVDDKAFYKAFQQMTEKYFELTQSDDIAPGLKSQFKALLIHAITEILKGEYEYREALNFCLTQWNTFSTLEKKLLIEAIDKAIKDNEYCFKKRDSGEWDYVSDESATMLIDRSKKSKSLEFTRFLGRIPLVSLLSIRVNELIQTLNSSLQILQQLSHLPLEVRKKAIHELLIWDVLDEILRTLQGNVQSEDPEIKSATLMTLINICQDVDFGILQTFSQVFSMIQHHNREKVLDFIGAQLKQWSELSEMNNFLLKNVHSALLCPNPDVIKAGITCLRHHRMALERYHQEVINSLNIAIEKFTPSTESDDDSDTITLDTFEGSRQQLIQLRTQFETIRTRMNPPPLQPLFIAPVNLAPNAPFFVQPAQLNPAPLNRQNPQLPQGQMPDRQAAFPQQPGVPIRDLF